MNPFKIDDYVLRRSATGGAKYKVLQVHRDFIKIRTDQNAYFYPSGDFLLAHDSPQTSDAGAAEYDEAMKIADLIGEQS